MCLIEVQVTKQNLNMKMKITFGVRSHTQKGNGTEVKGIFSVRIHSLKGNGV